MKGLLLKDLFALRKQGRVILVFSVFYFILGNTTGNLSMFGTMVIVLSAMLPITTMSYDEYHKWDRYALAMPISRKSVVLSKYFLGVICSLAATLIVTLGNIVISLIGETEIFVQMLSSLGFIMVAILFIALVLPIMFKFGVEKGRIFMIMIAAVPTLIIMMLPKIGFQLPSEEALTILAYFSPLIVIGLLLLSIRISMGIYNRKEF